MRHSKNSGIVNNLVKEKFSNWAIISLLPPPFSKAFRIKKSKERWIKKGLRDGYKLRGLHAKNFHSLLLRIQE